ncbi:MAG: phosphopentomutase [Oscillospiraceae bacterium]|nr:phosphopentomutase [Oscillospiraceae bacterium]MDY5095918.1 phosphopentomutase [Oscillospiraceae bacterium]
MAKRVFLIVLDSFGIGEEPDAAKFGDHGVNTLRSVSGSSAFAAPNLIQLGLFNIDGVGCGTPANAPSGAFARLQERSNGKDTTIGHWEIAGLVSPKALPTYPNGFPENVIREFSQKTGRGVLCNKPYSGTEVIKDYGEEHLRTGSLIVYTSADSVFQIAAHEEVVPLEELYRDCQIAREMLQGDHGVGRVIARPFVGTNAANFQRTSNRHDFSITPPRATMLDEISAAGLDMIAVGKINDIFAGRGATCAIRTKNNDDGMRVTMSLAGEDFRGLAFINLVDFDMLYGHRRDIPGYAAAISSFDRWLPGFLAQLKPDDLLMITADHGCDPAYLATTDHTREYVPWLITGPAVQPGVNLGTLQGFGNIAATICAALNVPTHAEGKSQLAKFLK